MNISAGDYWLLIGQAGTETKIIFIIFALMSFVCAVIVGMKLMSLSSKMRVAHSALRMLRSAKSIDDILAISKKFQSTAIGALIDTYLRELKQSAEKEIFSLSDFDYNNVQDGLEQAIDEIMYNEESYMPVVSTSAAVSTLIGLFGTVSGLIHSFINIAQVKTADISVIAPGIAEALMTTWGGLIIAISFLALFYVVQSKIRYFEHTLVKISDQLMWLTRSVLN